MGIPEPSSPLWAAVRALSNPWPPDDEVVAATLGQTWRETAGRMAEAVGRLNASAQAVNGGWPDQAGATMYARLTANAGDVDALQREMQRRGAAAETYAEELRITKSAITAHIAAMEPVFALAGNPLLAAAGPVSQDLVARAVAGQLNAMVAERAAGMAVDAVVEQLPAPPSDAELLANYQTDDDLLPPIGLPTSNVTWSEAIEVIESGDPAAVWNIKTEAENATAGIFTDTGRPGVTDNHRDAFRHAYLNALLTQRFGKKTAELIATAHERGPDDTPKAARSESMDLHNNQVGRDIAERLGPNASQEDLRRAVEQAVRDGKLVVFDKDKATLVPSGGAEDF